MFEKNKLFLVLTGCLMFPVAQAQIVGAPGAHSSGPAISAPSAPRPSVVPAVGQSNSATRQQARQTLEQMAQQSNPSFASPLQPTKLPASLPPAVSALPSPVVHFTAPVPKPILVAVTGHPGHEMAEIAVGGYLYTVKPGSKVGSTPWALERINLSGHEVTLIRKVGKRHLKKLSIWFVQAYNEYATPSSGGLNFSPATRFTAGAYGAVPTLPPPVTANSQ